MLTEPYSYFAALDIFRGTVPKDVKPTSFDLPLSDPEHIDQITRVAIVQWNERYCRNDVISALDRSMYERTEELGAYFKSIRKAGLIYRSIVRYVGVDRNIDPQEQRFLKLLGTFNDYYPQYCEPEIFDELKSLSGCITQVTAIEQVSVSTVHDRIKEDILSIASYMSHESEGCITVADFHEIRKLLKHVMNIYQMQAFLTRDESAIQQFMFLHDLVGVMGNIHDEVVQSTLGDHEAYNQRQIEVGEYRGLVDNIQYFCQQMSECFVRMTDEE